MAFACPRCEDTFDKQQGLAMHILNKQDSAHSDCDEMYKVWKTILESDQRQVDPSTYSGGSKDNSRELTPETDETAVQSLLEIEPPVELRSASTGSACPLCGGSLDVLEVGTVVHGTYRGQSVTVETETGDSRCPWCDVLVTSDGEIIR